METQQDFYKGIFLTQMLQTLTGFTYANISSPNGGTAFINGKSLTDVYAELKTLSEQFADIMINGVTPPQP